MPSMQRMRSVSKPFASRSADSKQHWAITGSMALSSICAASLHIVTHSSLPITLYAIWFITSGITGFTLPGMIDDPGWRAGRLNSPRPQRGPEASRRRSLQILFILVAMRFMAAA